MGITGSCIRESPLFQKIQEQHIRFAGSQDTITVDELLKIHLPRSMTDFDMKNFAGLSQIDSDRDGLFSMEDVAQFAALVNRVASVMAAHELCKNVTAKCIHSFIEKLGSNDGIYGVSDWVIKLIVAGDARAPSTARRAHDQHISRDSLAILYTLIGRMSDGHEEGSFFTFYTSLKQCERELRVETGSDDTVHALIVREVLLKRFLQHYLDLMTCIPVGG